MTHNDQLVAIDDAIGQISHEVLGSRGTCPRCRHAIARHYVDLEAHKAGRRVTFNCKTCAATDRFCTYHVEALALALQWIRVDPAIREHLRSAFAVPPTHRD